MLDFITWTANPNFIDSFVTIRWYGLAFAIGFWIGYEIMYRIFKHEGVPEKWIGALLIYVVLGTIIGARLGHVFFYDWDYYSQHPGDIIKIWEGGLASHGARGTEGSKANSKTGTDNTETVTDNSHDSSFDVRLGAM